MKHVLFTLALSTLCFAQTDAKAKKVIDDAVAALGGEKFLTMEDRIESGRAYSFYREQLSGLSIAKIYTRYITPGNSAQDLGVREKQTFGKAEDSAVLFREDGAWDITFRGARLLEQDRVTRYHDTTLRNIFYILRQRLKEPGLTFESKELRRHPKPARRYRRHRRQPGPRGDRLLPPVHPPPRPRNLELARSKDEGKERRGHHLQPL